VSSRTSLRVFRAATATARADLAAIYSWQSWLFGWLVRILAQVVFFALIGRLVGSRSVEHYLVIGNAVGICVQISMMVVASTAWERSEGTLPLLIAAPGSLPAVFVGRSVQWIGDGTACACIALYLVGAGFGVPFPMPSALLLPPLVLLVSVSTYCFGLGIAGLVLRAVSLRNVASNVSYLLLVVLAGAEVPRDYFPTWLRAIGDLLPMTHGLAAVRAVLAGQHGASVAGSAALELLVAIGWLLVAGLVFRLFAEGGRRTGSIEFS
jgi:ABC-2 type transport system permease protein